MFLRRKLLLAVSLSVSLSVALTGQTSSTSSQSSTQRSLDETKRDFDRLLTTSRQLQENSLMPRPRNSILPVLLAIPEFRKATATLRDAVGAKTDLREPVRDIEKLLKPFDEYFDDLKMKVPPVNDSNFKDFSGNDFIWESLTTAERIDNNLQVSLLLLQESERSGAISIKAMQFMNEIQSDMVRFRWLADRVSSLRRLSD